MKDKILTLGLKVSHRAKKYAPQIMVVSGLIFVGVGIYETIKGTKKMPETTAIRDAALEEINTCEHDETYSDKDRKKDKAAVYKKYWLSTAYNYSGAIACEVIGYSLVLGGMGIISKRYSTLLGSYLMSQETVKEYRARVRDKVGVDKEAELYSGITTKTTTKTVEEDGQKVKKTSMSFVGDLDKPRDFSFCFDESCGAWVNNPEYNRAFAEYTMRYLCDEVATEGFITGNRIFREFERAPGTYSARDAAVWGVKHDKNKIVPIDYQILDNGDANIWIILHLDYIWDQLDNKEE